MMNAGLGALTPNPNPMAAQPQPFQQLLALDKAVKAANLGVAKQGEQAIAEAGQGFRTVKDDLEMAYRQALGAFAPQPAVPRMANGGLVAFQAGGSTDPEVERILRKAPYERTPEDNAKLRAAGIDVQQRSIAPGSWIQRLDSFLSGTPTLGRTAPVPPAQGRVRPDETATLPTPAPIALQPLTSPTGGGGSRPLAARTPPPAVLPTVVNPNIIPGETVEGVKFHDVDITDVNKLEEAERQRAANVRKSAELSPELRAMRGDIRKGMERPVPEQAYLQELMEQKGRGWWADPEALSAMLANLGEARTFSQGLAGAGAGAMKVAGQREKEVRDLKLKVAQLDDARRQKLLEQDYAWASGDRDKAIQAGMDADKIEVEMRKLAVDMKLKARELPIKEVDAAARLRAAKAAENRPVPGASDEAVELRRMQSMRADPRYAGLSKEYEEAVKLANAVPSNPTLKARVQRAQEAIDALAREYNVARMQPTPGSAAPAPGATRLRFDAQGNPIP